MKNIYVGVATLEVHLPEARSLKQKRGPIRQLVDRIRSRHQVLAVEADGQDLHQRATVAVCAVSTDPTDSGESSVRFTKPGAGTFWAGTWRSFRSMSEK